MRVPATTSVVVKPEHLRLVRRDDSRYWQVHFKIDGVKTWIRKALTTEDLQEAQIKAERMWMKATFDHEDGRPIVSRKFKAVAKVVMQAMEDDLKEGAGQISFKDYIPAIRNYLIPFFGAYNVDCISQKVINQFHVWRTEMVGRELSASAQSNHNAALNRIFDEAIERGYMSENQRPALKNTGAASGRRAEFSHEELMQLIQYADKFVKDGRTERTRLIRELMSIYVPFMAATGMRPGTEAEFLEWRHIDVEFRDGQPVLHFRLQKGKRGARNFVAHNSCWLLLEKLKRLDPQLKDLSLDQVLKNRIPKRLFRLGDGTVPHEWNKAFRQWVEGAKLLNCPVTGKERTLYSLRHYYATQRLLEGIPIHDLAEQMGTSVPMITKHYSHLTPLMKAKQFAGTVDENAKEAEQIKSLMQAQMVNNNIMSLIQQSTGFTLPMIIKSPDFSKELDAKLKSRHKVS